MTTAFRIEKLRREHAVDAFDCGREELNRFLRRFAFSSQQAGAASPTSPSRMRRSSATILSRSGRSRLPMLLVG